MRFVYRTRPGFAFNALVSLQKIGDTRQRRIHPLSAMFARFSMIDETDAFVLSLGNVNMPPPPFEFVDFSRLPATDCPCGTARRGFTETPDFPGTFHLTEISKTAKKHYHQDHLEVYYFLECQDDAQMELDDHYYPIQAGQCLLIRPGTRHRAIGEMKVLILSMPKFDPLDEFFGD